MRKRRSLSTWGSRFTPTPEELKARGVLSGREAWEAEKAAEKERAEAPIKAILEETQKAVRQTQKVIAAYWSQPVAEIQKECEKNAAAVDTLFEVPALRDSFTVEDLQASFTSWFDNMSGAYTLSQSGEGGPRLFLFGLMAARRSGCDMSNPAAWQSAFDRLRDIGAFQPGEVAFDSSKVAVEPEPVAAPQLSARQQLESDMHDEMAPIAQQWLASLKDRWDFRPSDSDIRLIFGTNTLSHNPDERGLFFRLNLNPLRIQDYDKIRRFMVNKSYWPEALRTVDELLSDEIERSRTPLEHMTTEDRFNLIASLERIRPKATVQS
jgi:hypothetical protein